MKTNCSYQTTGPSSIYLNCDQSMPQDFDWFGYSLHIAIYIAAGIVATLVLRAIIKSGIFVVKQQSRAIIERFGKYSRTAEPGLNFKIPVVDRIIRTQWLHIEQLDVHAETKTKDDVFVKITIAVQNKIIADKAAESWYMLDDPDKQITSSVLDVVRAKVPTMNLDEVFSKKADVAEAINTDLTHKMLGYGYEIEGVLITEIDPADSVKNAMNEIQTQRRLQMAADAEGERNKIIVVKAAEAEAESKRLQGEGIAKQRTAIAAGLKESVQMVAAAAGVNPAEVLTTVMLTQYFDTIKEIGVSAHSKVILLPHSPAGMTDLMSQIRTAMVSASEVTEHPAAEDQP